MRPSYPPKSWRSNLRVATRERGPGGRRANLANRANRADPPPSNPAPARQVTLQVTYGVGWGANRANRRVGGVEHRDLVIGHGSPWEQGQLLFEEWQSIHFCCSSEAF